MELYIPHSIFHLARLLYVRPETFGPYYVYQTILACLIVLNRNKLIVSVHTHIYLKFVHFLLPIFTYVLRQLFVQSGGIQRTAVHDVSPSLYSSVFICN